MGSIDNIKKAAKELYKEVEEFVKKRGATLAIIGSITGTGGCWVNHELDNVWKHVHNIEQLDEKFNTIDSTCVVVNQMHDVYKRDSIAFHMYRLQMVAFFDTLPSMINQAQTAQEALKIVTKEINRIDSTQKEIHKEVELVLTGEVRDQNRTITVPKF
jgi:archaellum component FlaC